jgi:anti-sigma factor RsiW
MVDKEDTPEPDARTVAELSALADGTLDPGRVAAVRELIARSPSLSQRYDREREAVVALQALRADRAPARLKVEIGTRRPPARKPMPRLAFGGALAGAVVAAVAVIVLLLPGGSPGAPSVSQAAALSLRGPAMAAPLADRTQGGTRLKQDVEEVYFPNWSWRGWRATGQRVDRLNEQRAVTVYYQRGARQIAYTILAAPALRWPGTAQRQVHGVEFQSFTARGRTIITWRRTGHTCVLSGAGVSADTLAKLAFSH